MNVSYKYDLNGHYYELTGSDKLKEISEKEYLEKTGDNLKNVENLRNSRYPEQINDYVMLKPPKSYPSRDNNLIPVDYQIANIIKLFWKKGIVTKGIDKSGRIDIEHKTVSGKDVIPVLIKLFGDKYIKIFDIRDIEFKSDDPNEPELWMMGDEYLDFFQSVIDFRKRIKIIINNEWVIIIFTPSSLPWMYEKLNIKQVPYKNALKGNRVIMDRDLGDYKIV